MTYWVYENIPLRRTRVHLGSCSFCRDGRGIHGGGKRPSGAWYGPFDTVQEAERLAASRKRLDNQKCPECLPISEEEATEQEATMGAAESLRLQSVMADLLCLCRTCEPSLFKLRQIRVPT
jgi:hypothetical protein